MPYLDVDGAELWVEEAGTGDRVVLSCAMGFGRYPAILAQPPVSAHVFTVQARGFGRSTHADSPLQRGGWTAGPRTLPA